MDFDRIMLHSRNGRATSELEFKFKSWWEVEDAIYESSGSYGLRDRLKSLCNDKLDLLSDNEHVIRFAVGDSNILSVYLK